MQIGALLGQWMVDYETNQESPSIYQYHRGHLSKASLVRFQRPSQDHFKVGPAPRSFSHGSPGAEIRGNMELAPENVAKRNNSREEKAMRSALYKNQTRPCCAFSFKRTKRKPISAIWAIHFLRDSQNVGFPSAIWVIHFLGDSQNDDFPLGIPLNPQKKSTLNARRTHSKNSTPWASQDGDFSHLKKPRPPRTWRGPGNRFSVGLALGS